jgi:hypothetical protein
VLKNAKAFFRLRYADEPHFTPLEGAPPLLEEGEEAAAADGEAAAAPSEEKAAAAPSEDKAAPAALPAEPEAARVGPAPVQFACRTCRHNLFDLSSITPHRDAGLRPSHRGHADEQAGDGMCAALFVARLPWMAVEGSEGKLVCPQCGAKVGRWSLAGIQCSCGGFCSPGIAM